MKKNLNFVVYNNLILEHPVFYLEDKTCSESSLVEDQ